MKIHPLGVTDWILELVKHDFLFFVVFICCFFVAGIWQLPSKTNMQQVYPPWKLAFFSRKGMDFLSNHQISGSGMSFREGILFRFWLPQLEVEQKSGLAWLIDLTGQISSSIFGPVLGIPSKWWWARKKKQVHAKHELAQDVVFFKPNIKSI